MLIKLITLHTHFNLYTPNRFIRKDITFQQLYFSRIKERKRPCEVFYPIFEDTIKNCLLC